MHSLEHTLPATEETAIKAFIQACRAYAHDLTLGMIAVRDESYRKESAADLYGTLTFNACRKEQLEPLHTALTALGLHVGDLRPSQGGYDLQIHLVSPKQLNDATHQLHACSHYGLRIDAGREAFIEAVARQRIIDLNAGLAVEQRFSGISAEVDQRVHELERSAPIPSMTGRYAGKDNGGGTGRSRGGSNGRDRFTTLDRNRGLESAD